jgi:KaiC/GvpD/RAD55 family RecA-like ATPase
MADIELEVLSRAVMVGGIDQLIAAGLEPRHFVDPETRAVFETCKEHYANWRRSLSPSGVKKRHPKYQFVPVSDELGYLIHEFRLNCQRKVGLSATLDLHKLIERAESGDRDAQVNFVDYYMETARRVGIEAPGDPVERFSDMADRLEAIRKQQESGELPGVPTGIPSLDRYVRAFSPGEFIVHCGFSSRGKTQSLVRSSVPAYAAGDVVLMNSLEMTPAEVWEIYDAEAARLSRKAIRRRELGEADYERYAETAARVKMAKNDIIYTRAETVDKLMAQADLHNAKTVCVDYISLMQSTRRAAADWERVKDISSSLKQMALGMGVRVYAAAQSGRPAAYDGPTEDNIAHGQSIFSDCNVMIGWHQTPEMARVDKMQGRLIKNRSDDKGPPGESGYFEFYEFWDRDRMQFEPWTQMHEWNAKQKLGT